jgi:branched-chain amino acid transport system permease protein
MLRRLGRAETAAVLLFAAAFAVPFVTDSPLIYSITNQVLVGVVGALSVYIMLRMNLLTFATPAFMALGGYFVAIAGVRGEITNAFVLILGSFMVPAVAAALLGVLVLRLRGTYFVLVTFVLSQILQLVLFVTPDLTGGSNGIAGIPAVTAFGISIDDNRSVLVFACVLALLGALITAGVTRYFRQHFAAIEENEILAESLGLVVWRYKVLGFIVAAGVAGLAGFSLVNMLLTAHPSSFSSESAVAFIAYTIVGGRSSMLGAIVGSVLLVTATDVFGSQGQYSQGLYGVLIVLVMLAARGGIVGTIGSVFSARVARFQRQPATREIVP